MIVSKKDHSWPLDLSHIEACIAYIKYWMEKDSKGKSSGSHLFNIYSGMKTEDIINIFEDRLMEKDSAMRDKDRIIDRLENTIRDRENMIQDLFKGMMPQGFAVQQPSQVNLVQPNPRIPPPVPKENKNLKDEISRYTNQIKQLKDNITDYKKKIREKDMMIVSLNNKLRNNKMIEKPYYSSEVENEGYIEERTIRVKKREHPQSYFRDREFSQQDEEAEGRTG